MRISMAIAAAAALLAAPAAAAAETAAPSAAAQDPSGIAVTRDFLLGSWTDTGDCSNTVTFHRDGRFTLSAGGNGTWSLVGNQLTFTGAAGSRSARVVAPDRNRITLHHPDGSTGGSTRCTSAPAAAQRLTLPPLPGSADEVVRMSRPIERSYLLGRWTDDGNCGNVIEFLSDGRFVLTEGGNGHWQLAGEQLTFIGNSEVTARVRGVGNNRILLVHRDGSIGQSLRC